MSNENSNDKNQEKTGLSKALSNVSGNGGAAKGGLGGALARRDGSKPAVTGPEKANVTEIKKALNETQSTSQAIANDQARDLAARCGVAFVVDATGSREYNWREAQSIQASMFDAIGDMQGKKMGVICHRGQVVESLGWFSEAKSAKNAMAAISCVGGQTRVCPSLETALNGTGGKPPSAVILTGDCFEESQASLEVVADRLARAKVPVYAFIDGTNSEATHAFQYLADKTGGVFKRFGEGLELQDLCVAATVLSLKGQQEFERLLKEGHKGALALQDGIKRKQLGSGNIPKLGM